jgi:hypothetical protein
MISGDISMIQEWDGVRMNFKSNFFKRFARCDLNKVSRQSYFLERKTRVKSSYDSKISYSNPVRDYLKRKKPVKGKLL